MISDKVVYVPNYITSSDIYEKNFSVNSALKKISYKPDYYNPDTCVRFILNSNGFMDPYSLNLMFTVHLEQFNFLQWDSSAHSIIDSIIFSCNGVEIERIENYAYINSILFDVNLDCKARDLLKHHGFGCANNKTYNTGTCEDYLCDYATEQLKNNLKLLLEKEYKNNINDTIDGSLNDIKKKTKTYNIPLMSFIFGMNISEYKFIPLYLFPFLQIDINFNKYAMVANRYNPFIIGQNTDMMNNNMSLKLKLKYVLDNIDVLFPGCTFARVIRNNDLPRFKDGLLKLIILYLTDLTLQNELYDILYDTLALRDALGLNENVGFDRRDLVIAGKTDFFNNNLQDALIRVLFISFTIGQQYRADNIQPGNLQQCMVALERAKALKSYFINEFHFYGRYILATDQFDYGNVVNFVGIGSRKFSIKDPLIVTEQLFFDSSWHFQMINKIQTFSLFTLAYDTYRVEFDQGRPKENVTVNFPRQSIKKFMSCFYNKRFTSNNYTRQLARYSCNVLKYRLRIGTNFYPKDELIGNTSSTSREVDNNLMFFDEFSKAFNYNNYTAEKGIINVINYSLNFQKSDTFNLNFNNNLILSYVDEDAVGRGIICLRTTKIDKSFGVMNGEDNRNGNDIVRAIQSKISEVLFYDEDLFYEMIFIEYDLIFNVNGIGNYNIIK
jgi:hypothetical protein